MSPPDPPGGLRGGRFVITGELGAGAQGRTFEAFDRAEGRAVALKRFDVHGAVAWKDVELAEREARVLQSLRHPSLPVYVDHFEQDGALYLAMEKIEGESLASLRAREEVLSEADVVRLLRDASDVLDYLHGRAPPVIHRDLKPGNIVRRPDGSFAFVDFGAVRDKLRPEGGSTVVGTFGYMAPEQFQGRALPASDVYAIGATALTLLTGRAPEDLPHRGLAIDVRAALQGCASAWLVEALEKMLEPDPDVRASRIAPLLEGRVAPVHGAPPGPASAPAPDRPRPLTWGMTWVILAAVAALGGVLKLLQTEGLPPNVLAAAFVLVIALPVAWFVSNVSARRRARVAQPPPSQASTPPRVRVEPEQDEGEAEDDDEESRRKDVH